MFFAVSACEKEKLPYWSAFTALFSANVRESVWSVPFGRFGAVCYAKSIEYFSTNVCERADYV